MSTMTMIQAQQRYMNRVLTCHPGHRNRVRRAAARELHAWAVARGLDPVAVHRDAKDMVTLELLCDE